MKSFKPSSLVLSKLNCAVMAAIMGLSVNTAIAAEAEAEAQEIEEVVAVGQSVCASIAPM